MLKHTFYAIGLGLFVFILYLLQYTGAFKSVTVALDDRKAYQIISKDFIGPYHKIVGTIQEVETWAKSKGLSCRLSFGEYFDNPALVEEGRLRSRGGCLIDPQSEAETKLAEQLRKELPEGFQLNDVPATKAVVALFSGAPGIGPMKVYPKAEEFILENKLTKAGPVIEIYEIFDKQSMQTTYVWPLIN